MQATRVTVNSLVSGVVNTVYSSDNNYMFKKKFAGMVDINNVSVAKLMRKATNTTIIKLKGFVCAHYSFREVIFNLPYSVEDFTYNDLCEIMLKNYVKRPITTLKCSRSLVVTYDNWEFLDSVFRAMVIVVEDGKYKRRNVISLLNKAKGENLKESPNFTIGIGCEQHHDAIILKNEKLLAFSIKEEDQNYTIEIFPKRELSEEEIKNQIAEFGSY